MAVPFADIGPMTVDEFHAFTATRRESEKWELIDGDPILNAPPSPPHLRIVRNVTAGLFSLQRQTAASWEVLPGLGVRVSDTDRPEPDVVVVPLQVTEIDARQAFAAFEVLSPSTRRRDLTWKRTAYQSIPSLTDYVVIAQDAVEVVVFARHENFAGRRLSSLNDTSTSRRLAFRCRWRRFIFGIQRGHRLGSAKLKQRGLPRPPRRTQPA